MNKATLTLCVLALTTSVALAQQKATTAAPAAASKAAVAAAAAMPATATATVATPAVVTVPVKKIFTGTIKSVSMADAVKGTKSEIAVTNDAGGTSMFLVKATTTLYDADAKATMLNKIAVGTKVSVTYTITPENMYEAKSVKTVK